MQRTKSRRTIKLMFIGIMCVCLMIDTVNNMTYVNAETTHYTYDSLGRVKTITYSDGTKITYVYDKNGNIKNIVVDKSQKPSKPEINTTESRTTESRTTEGRTTESKTTEGKTTESRTTEDRTTESRTTESRTTESRTTEGRTTESRTTESRTTEDRKTEGGTTEESSTEFKATEEGTTEVNSTEDRATEGGTTEGSTTESSSTEDDTEEEVTTEKKNESNLDSDIANDSDEDIIHTIQDTMFESIQLPANMPLLRHDFLDVSQRDVRAYNQFKKKKPIIKSLKIIKKNGAFHLKIQIRRLYNLTSYPELGYQIQYGTNHQFKNAATIKITRNSKRELTATSWKVKKNKTYYVKVRAYVKTRKGKNIYTKYSQVKKLTVN